MTNETGQWIVMCRVSGGVTGTRVAPLKRNGAVAYFETRDAATVEAARCAAAANGDRYRTAHFQYWAEPVGRDAVVETLAEALVACTGAVAVTVTDGAHTMTAFNRDGRAVSVTVPDDDETGGAS